MSDFLDRAKRKVEEARENCEQQVEESFGEESEVTVNTPDPAGVAGPTPPLSGARIFPFPLAIPAHHGASQDPPVPHRGVGLENPFDDGWILDAGNDLELPATTTAFKACLGSPARTP